MPFAIVRFQMGSFDRWKQAFDSLEGAWKEAGIINARMFRSSENPEEVIVFSEETDLDKSRQLKASPRFQATMKNAGIKGPPEVTFVGEMCG